MAEAQIGHRTEVYYTLTMTKDEAQAVFDVLGHVDGTGQRRQHTESVFEALELAGMVPTYDDTPYDEIDITGGVSFEDR